MNRNKDLGQVAPVPEKRNSATASSPDTDEVSGPATYVDQIASLFLSLRGSGLFLSPRDMQTILEWEVRDVPIQVVMRGLVRGAQRLHARRRPIRTLARLRPFVERAQRSAIRQALSPPSSNPTTDTGASPEPDRTPEPENCGRIENWIEGEIDALESLATRTGTEPAVVHAAGRAIESLRRVRGRVQAQSRDRTAGDILEVGRTFYVQLLETLPRPVLDELQTLARASLRGLDQTMSADALGETLTELTIVVLRERLGVFDPSRILDLLDP